MNIRHALVLLLELVLTVAVIAFAIWIFEKYIGKIPDLVKVTIAIVLVILLLLALLGAIPAPLITW